MVCDGRSALGRLEDDAQANGVRDLDPSFIEVQLPMPPPPLEHIADRRVSSLAILKVYMDMGDSASECL